MTRDDVRVVVCACLLGACPLQACVAPPAGGIADAVVEAPGAREGVFGDPSLATNGVRGGGASQGSLDVFSIRPGEHLVLEWTGRRAVDGPGPDLAVFENPFDFFGGTFVDPVVVEVSRDGAAWVAFPHRYDAADSGAYSYRREDWVGFAGRTPVALHEETNPLDPFDPAAGGDTFDLASLGDGAEASRIREEGFRFLRLSPASDHIDPQTDAAFPRDPVSDGPDIDGVAARYLVEDGA